MHVSFVSVQEEEDDVGIEVAPDHIDRTEEGILAELGPKTPEPPIGDRGPPPPAIKDDASLLPGLRKRGQILGVAGEVEQLPSKQ